MRLVGEEPDADHAGDELCPFFERWKRTFVLFVPQDVPQLAEEAADGARVI